MSIKQYDTLRAIRKILELGGAALDVTGCTVTVLKKRIPTGALDEAACVAVVERPCTIVDGAAGVIEWTLTDDDVSTAADFELEYKVVSPAPGRLTVPTVGRDQLTIEAALA